MIIDRETSHEALHIAGATTVRSLGRNRFDVTPDINEKDLPAAEEEAAKRQIEREAKEGMPSLREKLQELEMRIQRLENNS